MARKKKNTKTVDVVNPVCCGIDVHKASVSACLMYTDKKGRENKEVRVFSTFTDDLINLREWLLENNCPVVAMESTGVYWHSVHNILEGHVHVVLVNAKHYKNVPGKKTDVQDCQWLAALLRHGLLKGSFIPPQDVRDWRDLNKLRKKYVQTVADHKRRVSKVFHTANIKIDNVATDLFGATGRNLMELLGNKSMDDITEKEIEACLMGSLRGKATEMYRAMKGFFRDHHRFSLKAHLSTIESLERTIEQIDQRLGELTSPHQELLDRLDEIPGVDQVAAREIIGQLGVTLEEFPSASHVASWAGVCPGNNESAGKRKSGKTKVKGHDLKTILVEVSWAAVKTKGCYYREKYFRLKSRRGSKRAIIAIAHRILKAIYHIIKYGESYRELGEEYLIKLTEKASLKRLTTMATKHGYTLVPVGC